MRPPGQDQEAGRVDILIVDDHPSNLVALEGILSDPAYRLVRASDGREALRHVLRQDFCVILLDIFMPGMDGFEVARILKERERSRHIPIIFLTAGAHDARYAFKAYSIGAVDYLEKPVDPDIVRSKVAVFVDLYRKTEQVKRQGEQLRDAERRDRDRALAELRTASERRFMNLADAIPEVVWTASAAGDTEYLNRRWTELTGLTRQQGAGTGWAAAVHPDDLPRTLESWKIALRTGAPFQAEHRLRRAADGAWRWQLVRAVPERAADGSIAGWIGTATDIDDRKRAEEERGELLRSEQAAHAQADEAHRRAAFLAEASRELAGSLDPAATIAKIAALAVPRIADWCAVFVTEPDGTTTRSAVAHADPGKQSLVSEFRARQRTLDPAAAHPVLDVIRRRKTEVVPVLSEEALAASATGPEELEILRALDLRSTILVPLVARGRALGAIRIARGAGSPPYGPEDVPLAEEVAARAALALDNARLYREAEQAIATRDEFLSIASHELNTPLTALKLHVQWLRREAERLAATAGGDGKCEERTLGNLASLEKQVSRLSTLIVQLLDVSHLKRGRLPLEPERVDLRRLVQEVAERFEGELSAARCVLEVAGEERLEGRWDPIRLDQLVTNLLGNAVKYGAGKPIRVTIEREGDRARLRVRDQGIGMDPRDLDRIFERFERAVSPRRYGGLGLGLYISRQIVEAHGGTISASSAPGQGATFTVELPLEPTYAPPPTAPEPPRRAVRPHEPPALDAQPAA